MLQIFMILTKQHTIGHNVFFFNLTSGKFAKVSDYTCRICQTMIHYNIEQEESLQAQNYI